jgi:hypothetical protein
VALSGANAIVFEGKVRPAELLRGDPWSDVDTLRYLAQSTDAQTEIFDRIGLQYKDAGPPRVTIGIASAGCFSPEVLETLTDFVVLEVLNDGAIEIASCPGGTTHWLRL